MDLYYVHIGDMRITQIIVLETEFDKSNLNSFVFFFQANNK